MRCERCNEAVNYREPSRPAEPKKKREKKKRTSTMRMFLMRGALWFFRSIGWVVFDKHGDLRIGSFLFLLISILAMVFYLLTGMTQKYEISECQKFCEAAGGEYAQIPTKNLCECTDDVGIFYVHKGTGLRLNPRN